MCVHWLPVIGNYTDAIVFVAISFFFLSIFVCNSLNSAHNKVMSYASFFLFFFSLCASNMIYYISCGLCTVHVFSFVCDSFHFGHQLAAKRQELCACGYNFFSASIFYAVALCAVCCVLWLGAFVCQLF